MGQCSESGGELSIRVAHRGVVVLRERDTRLSVNLALAMIVCRLLPASLRSCWPAVTVSQRNPTQIAHHWRKEIAVLRHLDPAYDCGRDSVEDIISLAS